MESCLLDYYLFDLETAKKLQNAYSTQFSWDRKTDGQRLGGCRWNWIIASWCFYLYFKHSLGNVLARYKVDEMENLELLQNIQARIRMVVAFIYASIINYCHGFIANRGFISNVDEGLPGYLTKRLKPLPQQLSWNPFAQITLNRMKWTWEWHIMNFGCMEGWGRFSDVALCLCSRISVSVGVQN